MKIDGGSDGVRDVDRREEVLDIKTGWKGEETRCLGKLYGVALVVMMVRSMKGWS